MKFLLKLKHWQIFIIFWLIPITIILFLPSLKFVFLPMILICIGIYGWIWSIVNNLKSLIPKSILYSVNKFRILLLIPIVYLFLLTFSIIFFNDYIDEVQAMIVIIPLHIISTFITLWCMSFAAKVLKASELGRDVVFSEYMLEFILIWFSIVGYWGIQPRLNKLIELGG